MKTIEKFLEVTDWLIADGQITNEYLKRAFNDANVETTTPQIQPLESIFSYLGTKSDNKPIYNQPEKIVTENFNGNLTKEKPKIDKYFDDFKQEYRASRKQLAKSPQLLLNFLEEKASYFSITFGNQQVNDISAYQVVKNIIALADIYECFALKPKQTTSSKLRLVSVDVSGIQNYIYSIGVSRALRGLRARSLYLDLMVEVLVTDLLSKLNYSRANLLYVGGGRAYLLVDNSNDSQEKLHRFENETNDWFIKNFGTQLYVAIGSVPCTNEDIHGNNYQQYSNLFKEISTSLSDKKMHRYDASQLKQLNANGYHDRERECAVCRRSDLKLQEDKEYSNELADSSQARWLCSTCQALEKAGRNEILDCKYFYVTTEKNELALPMPNDLYMTYATKSRDLQASYLFYTGNYDHEINGIHFFNGNYHLDSANTLEKLAKLSTGIKRLAVLRCDVDNLGTTFVSGFNRENKHRPTLERISMLSFELSLFFKKNINYLLSNPQHFIFEREHGENSGRNAMVIYSGGDDVFIVGAWDDIIGLALDIKAKLLEYTNHKLNISAGVGFFNANYPISAMAEYTGDLEDEAKNRIKHDGLPVKNSIALFDENGIFTWDSIGLGKTNEANAESTVRKKINFLDELRSSKIDKNDYNSLNSFLYKLLHYVRNIENDDINIARLAYIIGRAELDQEIFQQLGSRLINWAKLKDKEQLNQFEMAIILTVYKNRKAD